MKVQIGNGMLFIVLYEIDGGGTMKCSGDGSLLFALFAAILSDAKSLHVGFDGAVNQEILVRSLIQSNIISNLSRSLISNVIIVKKTIMEEIKFMVSIENDPCFGIFSCSRFSKLDLQSKVENS